VKAAHRAYQRARQRLLDAQAALPAPFRQAEGEELPPEVAAVVAAEADLRAAEDAVADDLQAAWDRNRESVGAAKTGIVDARREQARVEVEAGTAAHLRDRNRPVLTDEERDRVGQARQKVAEAIEAHNVAQATFKQGVTPEQLAEVSGAV
jgi:hypothetical protein